jgi:hypothetical protein
MDAHDVKQGCLGDCYFLCALALVATDTCCVDGLVDDVFDASGCFGVSFMVHGKWQMVWVDSFFPCYTPTNKHAATPPRPVYASSANRREIWPMVVEKAWAKLHGTFEAIGGGGRIAAALQALTGGESWSVPVAVGRADRLWSGLITAVEDPNVLVGAGTRHDASDAVRRGVVDGHAYSVLHAVEVERRRPEKEGGNNKGGGGSFRLLLLRNPWSHGEWKGPWSDTSREWRDHPECLTAIGNCRSVDDDGEFWMDVDSFCEVFATLDMVRLPGGHRHRTKNAELTPLASLAEEDETDGHEGGAAPTGTGGNGGAENEDQWLVGTAADSSPTKERKHPKHRAGGKPKKRK